MPLWRGWKKRMTTQNQKVNSKKKEKKETGGYKKVNLYTWKNLNLRSFYKLYQCSTPGFYSRKWNGFIFCIYYPYFCTQKLHMILISTSLQKHNYNLALLFIWLQQRVEKIDKMKAFERYIFKDWLWNCSRCSVFGMI